jgi:hypothetical protein
MLSHMERRTSGSWSGYQFCKGTGSWSFISLVGTLHINEIYPLIQYDWYYQFVSSAE